MYEYEKKKLKNYLGDKLYDMLKESNCIVAGGSILSIFTNKEINDIDVYFKSKNDLRSFITGMKGTWIAAKTDKAVLFKFGEIKVQAIYFKLFNNVSDLFDTFDFTVCMCAYDFATDEFVFHEDFFHDNVAKILRFNENTAYPIVSALRVDKYKNKGFDISKAEFLKVILTCMNKEINTYEELKEQLGGMYGESYDVLLNPDDSIELNLQNVISNISKIGEQQNYNVCNMGFEVDDWDIFACEISGSKISVYKHGDIYIYYDYDEINAIDKDDLKDIHEITEELSNVIQFPIVGYKWVKKDNDGSYYSYFNNKYKWELGENTTDKECGLFFTTKNRIMSHGYSNKDKKACLEVLLNSLEDINFNIESPFCSNVAYKTLTVTREVPEEEYLKWDNK